jgi:hypothetical protein
MECLGGYSASHQVSICGQVKDASGERACGVRVNIVNMPETFQRSVSAAANAAEKKWAELDERFDRTETRVDGIFYFLDLPAGQYTLSFDTRSDSHHEKKVAVLWDVHLAIRDAVKGHIISPYTLMPHESLKIPEDNPVVYEVRDK